MNHEPEIQQYATVWDSITDTPEEAANLKARADLMIELRRIIKTKGWTQTEAATALGVTQPRISALMTGKIDQFGLDTLINMVVALGYHVDIQVRAVA